MNVLYDPILGCLRKSDVDPAATPEVVNVANFATLPTTGALATIYIVGYQDEYIWDGSGYVQLNAGSAPVQDAPLFFAIAATTAALPTVTYNNGAGTLTKSTNGALVAQDGITLAVGDVLLVKNQASTLQNGLYEVTTVGDGSNPFVLTRPTDYNQTAEIYPSQVNVLSGTTNGTKYFLQTTVDPTIGTDPIVYSSIATPVTVNYTVRFVSVHTTTVLPNSPTYANGSSLTAPAYLATYTATTNGAFPTLQGVAPYVNMIVLVKDQADATKNGDYQLITIGTASTKWKLRRISYSSGQFYRQLWEVYEGTDKGKFYEQTTSNLVSLNIGTTGNIVFADVSPTSLFTQGSGFAYLTTTTDLFQVGSSSSLGASLGVKGQGATSATLTENITNSSGDLIRQTKDDRSSWLYRSVNISPTDAAVNALDIFRVGSTTTKALSINIANTDEVRMFSSNSSGITIDVGGTNTASTYYNYSSGRVYHGAAASAFHSFRYNGIGSHIMFATYVGINVGEPINNASLAFEIKGVGSTSGTINQLNQNSSSQQLFKILDSGAVSFGSASDAVSLIDIYPVGGTNDFMRFNLFGGVNLKFAAAGNLPYIQTNQATISLLASSGAGGVDLGSTSIILHTGGTPYARFNNTASCTIIPATGYGLRIGDNTNDPSLALLDVVSTAQGFLPPRMTTAQRATLKTALIADASTLNGGMIVYDNQLMAQYYWDNSISDWVPQGVQTIGSANNKASNNKILYQATTDAATAVELTTDGAAGSGATNRIAVPVNTTLSIVLNICVKQSGSANAKQMLRQVVITNNGGTTALNGTPIALGTDTGDAGLATVSCTITANNTDDCLKVEVNGVALTNLRYTCFVVSTETTYA